MAIDTKVVELYLSIGTSQQEVLPDNPGRRFALLVNDGTTTFYLSLASPATANRGIRVNSAGGNYEINKTNPFYGKISAISDAAGGKLSIVEVSDAT